MISKIPYKVKFDDIEQFEDFDQRLSAADCLVINTLGVEDGYVEWCPNDEPPSQREADVWLWVIKPSLGKSQEKDVSVLIESYSSGSMESWWEEIAK